MEAIATLYIISIGASKMPKISNTVMYNGKRMAKYCLIQDGIKSIQTFLESIVG